ncbi:MAG: Cytochrome c oxidase subunit 2 precursor, partial [Pseudomonadota bacterium]
MLWTAGAFAGTSLLTQAHAVNDLPGGPAVNQLNLAPAVTKIAQE